MVKKSEGFSKWCSGAQSIVIASATIFGSIVAYFNIERAPIEISIDASQKKLERNNSRYIEGVVIIKNNGTKVTEDEAVHCPPLAGDQGGGLAQVKFQHIYNPVSYIICLNNSAQCNNW